MKQIGFHIPDSDDAPVSTSVLLGMSGVALRVIANLLVQVSSPEELEDMEEAIIEAMLTAERQSAESDFHRGQMLALGAILDTIHEIDGQPNYG